MSMYKTYIIFFVTSILCSSFHHDIVFNLRILAMKITKPYFGLKIGKDFAFFASC